MTDFKFISFIGTILLFIPTFIYFAIFFIKYYILSSSIIYLSFLVFLIPILNLYFLFKFVTHQKNTFLYYYLDEDGASVIVETREIQSPTHKIATFLLKLFIAILLLIGIGFFYYQIVQDIIS